MRGSQFDVVIVGGGCAGMTAAIGLAKSGFSAAVVEAAPFPGAENWSGCVYFCENLAHPDILGPDAVEGLAWERRLIERGLFGTDGHGLVGMTYRDSGAFRHCYTVLRPIFDHHLARLASRLGVVIFNATTAESLIRDDGRVVGVATQRGPLYGDLVFLAEGDASHLVTCEGYERYADQREAPRFLQGIKQVVELPEGAIEERFRVGPEEGVAYEMLIRNGTFRGKPAHLNMGGFVYTNRRSLSVGLVLPAEHLNREFGGDPNLLIEWFVGLPALAPWLQGGRRGVFGAKVIRGGGSRDIPRLIDDGLAIGGAATAIGIDFPYPNFTGPATRMGLLLVEAVRRIRADHGDFSHKNLEKHYLQPLQRTHHWKDVEFLRRWPGYVKRTTVFFDSQLDLVLGTAYIWTRSDRWLPAKWLNWVRLLGEVAGPRRWPVLRDDVRHLARALRLEEVVGRPGIWQLLFDGSINALRDLVRSPRANLPEAGLLQLHYSVAGKTDPSDRPPAMIRRWARRFLPVLAPAARRVYSNDGEPLQSKLAAAFHLLLQQVNMVDVLAAGGIGLLVILSSLLLKVWDRLLELTRRRYRTLRGIHRDYAAEARKTTDLTPVAAPAASHWENRLAQLHYETIKHSHIHVNWPRSLPDRNNILEQSLWHVCPARVYEARPGPQGQLQVVVNFENCIKCETCWRTSDSVDWARDGRHRFIYPVHSPAVARLLESAGEKQGSIPVRLLSSDNWWEPAVRRLADELSKEPIASRNGPIAAEAAELHHLLDRLERKLAEFDEALAAEPRTIDRARAAYLEMLARYAHQLAVRIREVSASGALAGSPQPGIRFAQQQLCRIATAMAIRAEARARRTWDQRSSAAAADGRHIRQHHLAGLRRLLVELSDGTATRLPPEPGLLPWLRAEYDARSVADRTAEWKELLDAAFPATAWRDLDRGAVLTADQDALLRRLLSQVPEIDPNHLATTLHPPLRKAFLAELGRRDPSLAFRAASHLWARDVARLAGAGSAFLHRASRRWAQGEEWASFTRIDGVQTAGGVWQGESLFAPAAQAHSLLVLLGDRLIVLGMADGSSNRGWHVEPLATLGLRSAGLLRVCLDHLTMPGEFASVDRARIGRAWNIQSAADLISIAFGMADRLCERAIGHAVSRVQFPGMFHDEEGRDTIGKFGAVKKMIAEMGTRRWLLETLDHVLSPADFSIVSVEQSALCKAVAAEVLGTGPGSLAYNAGQVFGGTGFSEDDVFARFYRDAAAWRFLGSANPEIWQHHGDDLLRHWRPDGQRLASLPGETDLFDQLAQRKALQAELDDVRVFRSHLRGLVNEWLSVSSAASPGRPTPSHLEARPRLSFPLRTQVEIAEGIARQDARLLVSKAMLLRLHARMEAGFPSATELALLHVWLQEMHVGLAEFDSCMRTHVSLATHRDDHPLTDPDVEPCTLYQQYLNAAISYGSGDFLHRPVDLRQPRFLPEMINSDPALSAADQTLRRLLGNHFGRPRSDHLSYERWVEKQHRPEPADLDFCRQHGFFRYPIPRDLGGEAKSKAEYYLLTSHCQRFADVSVSLTIQVNSSLGTVPVLLAREKDLPRALHDLDRFVGDQDLHEEVSRKLAALIAQLAYAPVAAAEVPFRELRERLGAAVGASPAVRALAHGFLEAIQRASRALTDFDAAALRRHLEDARFSWEETCRRGGEYRDEVRRRGEACDLFLRWIAAGQISAFALTEPAAGSDTARIATRAVLRSVPVDPDGEGVYRFVPFGGKEHRCLIDASRIEFQSDKLQPAGIVAVYRWSDHHPPSLIRFDDYDYETDDPHRYRWFVQGDRIIRFTDIAQIRRRDGFLWYDYWELTGSKMWITSGRMCGLMCLYAKTAEGVTAFMVDRHAEGLIVGKDEEKLGQCGSPTNELSLQAVRVPRENVIGIEGRGQVNALETLNVGRAGLAMSAMAQMEGLIEQSRAYAQSVHGELPAWVEWRLQRMEEERFISEAVAHEVVGRFDHPKTRSVRMESAIAKMLVSESLQRVIELAEEIHGIAGQTQLHLIEKRKRDARVLTIYEGTSEIQRFFILKELAAIRTAADSAARTRHTAAEAVEVESLRLGVRQRVEAAVEVFGQDIWQNPNLQSSCFVLAEAAAWLKAADSTLARLAWIDRFGSIQASARSEPLLAIGRQALLRCIGEVRNRLRRFDDELGHLRRGFYPEDVRAASLLFQQGSVPRGYAPGIQEAHPPRSDRACPLSILVILEPSAALVPQPHIENGRLCEAHWAFTPGDSAALETALRLRDQAPVPVWIDVVAVAPQAAAPVLREALACGADRARLLVTDHRDLSADSAARGLVSILRESEGRSSDSSSIRKSRHLDWDLVLTGIGPAGDEQGLVGRLTASLLGVTSAGRAAHLSVEWTDEASPSGGRGSEGLSGGESFTPSPLTLPPHLRPISPEGKGEGRWRVRSAAGHLTALPAVVEVEPELSLRPFTISGYLQGLARPLELISWPTSVILRQVELSAISHVEETRSKEGGKLLEPREAAVRIIEAIGLRGTGASSVSWSGSIADVSSPALLTDRTIAVIAADPEGNLERCAAESVVRAAQLIAGVTGKTAAVLLVAGTDEDRQRRALGQLRSSFAGDVVLLPLGGLSPEVCTRVLTHCWPHSTLPPAAVVGESWTEPVLAVLRTACAPQRSCAFRVRRLKRVSQGVMVETVRSQGKLSARLLIDAEEAKSCFITLTADAEVADEGLSLPIGGPGRVERCRPDQVGLTCQTEIGQLLDVVKAEAGVVRLADAEFIIDVGFGVGNRDGYEAVIEPLEKTLRNLGVRNLAVGGSRKVTEELHLLPADRQIGQSGVSVQPKILLAIGISGAPQHLNYIGPRTTIIAFNRDPESPIMTLNQRQPRPRVFPVVGDLFETVPALIAALRHEESKHSLANRG